MSKRDRIIGEVFNFEGHRLEVVGADDPACDNCFFEGKQCWKEELMKVHKSSCIKGQNLRFIEISDK